MPVSCALAAVNADISHFETRAGWWSLPAARIQRPDEDVWAGFDKPSLEVPANCRRDVVARLRKGHPRAARLAGVDDWLSEAIAAQRAMRYFAEEEAQI